MNYVKKTHYPELHQPQQFPNNYKDKINTQSFDHHFTNQSNPIIATNPNRQLQSQKQQNFKLQQQSPFQIGRITIDSSKLSLIQNIKGTQHQITQKGQQQGVAIGLIHGQNYPAKELILSFKNKEQKFQIKITTHRVKNFQNVKNQNKEVKLKLKIKKQLNQSAKQNLKLYCFCSDLGIVGYIQKKIYYSENNFAYFVEQQGISLQQIIECKVLSLKKLRKDVEHIVKKANTANISLKNDLNIKNIIYSRRLSRFILKQIQYSQQTYDNYNNNQSLIDFHQNILKIYTNNTKPLTIQVKQQNTQYKKIIASINQKHSQIIIINSFSKKQGYVLGRGNFGIIHVQKNKKNNAKKRIFYNGNEDMNYMEQQVLNQMFLLNICSDFVAPQLTSNVLIKTDQYYQFQMELCITLDKIKFKNETFEKLIVQLEKDLIQLHKLNIFHRDIKPDNICYSTIKKKFVLIDFGLGVYNKYSIQDCHLTQFCGTYKYLSNQMRKLRHQKIGLVNLKSNDEHGLKQSIINIRLMNDVNLQRLFLQENNMDKFTNINFQQKQLQRIFDITKVTLNLNRIKKNKNVYDALIKLDLLHQFDIQINFLKNSDFIKNTMDYIIQGLKSCIKARIFLDQWQQLIVQYEKKFLNQKQTNQQEDRSIRLNNSTKKIKNNYEIADRSEQMLDRRQRFNEFKSRYMILLNIVKIIKSNNSKQALIEYKNILNSNKQLSENFKHKLYLLLIKKYQNQQQKSIQIKQILIQYQNLPVKFQINLAIIQIILNQKSFNQTQIQSYLKPFINSQHFLLKYLPELYLKLNYLKLQIYFHKQQSNIIIDNIFIAINKYPYLKNHLLLTKLNYLLINTHFYNTQQQIIAFKNIQFFHRLQNRLDLLHQQIQLQPALKNIYKYIISQDNNIIQIKWRVHHKIPLQETLAHRNIFILDPYEDGNTYRVLISNYIVNVTIQKMNVEYKPSVQFIEQYTKKQNNLMIKIQKLKGSENLFSLIKQVAVLKLLDYLNMGLKTYKFFGADIIKFKDQYWYFVQDYILVENKQLFRQVYDELENFLFNCIQILHEKRIVLRKINCESVCSPVRDRECFKLRNLKNVRYVIQDKKKNQNSYTQIILQGTNKSSISSGIYLNLYNEDIKQIKKVIKNLRMYKKQVNIVQQQQVKNSILNIQFIIKFRFGFQLINNTNWDYLIKNLLKQYQKNKNLFQKSILKQNLLDSSITSNIISLKSKMLYCFTLDLSFNFITSPHLHFLPKFYQLIILNLSNNYLDHKIFSYFQNIQFIYLEQLNLWNNSIQDEGILKLAHIYQKSFPALIKLDISQNQIHTQSVIQLAKSNQKLANLNISNNQIVDNQSLMEQSNFKDLISLDIKNNHFTNKILASAIISSKIKYLYINNITLTKQIQLNPIIQMPLIELQLSNCKISNQLLKVLSSCTKYLNMKKLNLNKNMISSLDLILTGRWKKMEWLEIEGNKITRKQIQDIKTLDSKQLVSQLKYINLRGNPIVIRGIMKYLTQNLNPYFRGLKIIEFAQF